MTTNKCEFCGESEENHLFEEDGFVEFIPCLDQIIGSIGVNVLVEGE